MIQILIIIKAAIYCFYFIIFILRFLQVIQIHKFDFKHELKSREVYETWNKGLLLKHL